MELLSNKSNVNKCMNLYCPTVTNLNANEYLNALALFIQFREDPRNYIHLIQALAEGKRFG